MMSRVGRRARSKALSAIFSRRLQTKRAGIRARRRDLPIELAGSTVQRSPTAFTGLGGSAVDKVRVHRSDQNTMLTRPFLTDFIEGLKVRATVSRDPFRKYEALADYTAAMVMFGTGHRGNFELHSGNLRN